MAATDTVVATFQDHASAEAAIRKLAHAGFSPGALSIVGQGYHSEEKVIGFYNVGDRIRLWGSRGALWGALWGLLLGGLFLAEPLGAPVLVLGYLAVVVVSAVEGAIYVGGLSALGAALASIGIPKDSVLRYESAFAGRQVPGPGSCLT